MTTVEAASIACTLAPGELTDRLASIAALNREALRSHERRDLVLELRYAPEARARVHEMVRNEQACCAFLAFELHETENEIRLTVTAPETARAVADALFEQFVGAAPKSSSCACATSAPVVSVHLKVPPGAKAAGVTALTLSTGAVACGVCCVLPFAVPATVLAGAGTVMAWFVKMHVWASVLAILSVAGAWGWVAWQTRRTRRRPATSTLLVMAAATVLMTLAVLWPLVEKPLIRLLRA